MIMRFNITLGFETPLELPIQYNHILQGMIYDSLPDEGFRRWLHEKGMTYGKRNFKMFTFSRLLGKFRLDVKKRRIKFFDKAHLFVSSAIDEIISELGTGLLSKDISLIGQRIEVKEVRVLPEPEIGEKVRIEMLSPVVVYKTYEKKSKKYTNYYGPMDNEFNQLLADNIVRKYISLYGQKPENSSFNIKPLGQGYNNEKIIKYKGLVIKGWMGTFSLKGNPKLIKLAYDGGLGSKNSMGFGCFQRR